MDPNSIGTGTSNAPKSQTARQMIAAFAGALLFLSIASLIKPEPRTASAVPNESASAAPRPRISGNAARLKSLDRDDASEDISRRLSQTPHPKGWRLVGQLEGRENRLLMFASPEGPRYTVYSLAGDLLAPDLAADDVYRAFPDLDLSTLHDLPASDGKAIMLVTPIE